MIDRAPPNRGAITGLAHPGLGESEAGGAWPDLEPNASMFLRAPYLAYAAAEGFAGFRVEVHDDNRRLAGAVGWTADGQGHFYLEPAKIMNGLGLGDARRLVLGVPGAFRGEVAVRPGIDPATLADTANAMTQAVIQHAEASRAAGVVALYLDDASTAFLTRSDDASGPALMNFDTFIEVPESFEAWLDRFDQKRQREFRREMRRFADCGLTCAVETSDACILELAPIIAASEQRHGHASSPEGVAGTLMAQRARLGSGFAVFAARNADGMMVAGAVAFLDAETIHVRICGVDRAVAGRQYEYFNVVYYAPIRHAIATGRRRVQLGMESFDAKLARGARIEPRWGLRLGAKGPDAEAWATALPGWNRERIALLGSWAGRSPAAYDQALYDLIRCRAGV